MNLFEKWYNCYYQVVRHILAEAASHPIHRNRMNELAMQYGFLESSLSIIPKLISGQWPLLQENPQAPAKSNASYIPVLQHPEILQPGALPLTNLQKSWLKALLSDRRIRLFLPEEALAQAQTWLSGAEPLYSQEDFYYFDQYSDGDDYASLDYQKCFQTILNALEHQIILHIDYESPKKGRQSYTVLPCQLQYSSKNDKFRLCCFQQPGKKPGRKITLNLGRIKQCRLSKPTQEKQVLSAQQSYPAANVRFHLTQPASAPVVIQISGERNSLERCMLHFANYEKHTFYDEENKVWISSIYYDLADETELLVDILSFGPVIRVLSPESFLAQVRERVKKQHDLFYSPTA